MKSGRMLAAVLSVLIASSPYFLVSRCIDITSISTYAADTEYRDTELDTYTQYQNCGDHVEITGYDSDKAGYVSIPAYIEDLPVTKINAGAFKNHERISEVFLSTTIEEIDDEAFYGCTNLTAIHFPPALQRIGNRAFYKCTRSEIMIIPDTVSEIGEEAFAGCIYLKNVILPDRIRTIRRGTFSRNKSLNTISISGGVDRIECDAFKDCQALNTVCYKGSADAWSVLSIGRGNDSLESASVLCDYNKQKVDRTRTFNPEKDSWSFLNKEVEYYLLSDEKVEEMTKGMSQREKDKTIQQWNLRKKRGYSGSCAGIAMTSLLTSYGILDPSELDPDAQCLHDVQLTDDVRELITYYTLLQSSDVYIGDIFSDFKMFYYLEQDIPILISYQASGQDESGHMATMGHAVVAYGIEDGRFEFDGYVFTKRILTYDSNVNSENERDGSIYLVPDNSSSEKTFPDACIYVPYMAEKGFVPIFPLPICYSVDALNLHGLNKAVDYAEPDQKYALLRSSSLPENFDLMGYSPESPENKLEADYTAGKTGDFRILQCSDSNMGYTLEMQEKQALDCSMSYKNVLYTVNSSQVKSASFEPDGAISLRGEDMQYQLTMIADQHPTSYYELHMSGENTNEISVRQTDGGYVIAGTDLHDVTLEALNDSMELSLTFSTDASQVLVHETEDKTFTVSADLDGDKIFETVLTSAFPDLGDVNGDGSINAKDANEVLIAAAKIGTGWESGLSDAQQKAADVDHDGSINAVDAAWILRYAAAFGTGAFTGSMEEFVGDGATS